ncbi:hypothetical protein niasHT_026371 [Heterodera trifolii]|uniref:Homeobox domain-containing protein n=1 Tax=Heterodera trifolii TaxID=157864 RepID=A0ABD2KPU1_9BILA
MEFNNWLCDKISGIFDFTQQQKNFSADQLNKLLEEFAKTMCPSASARAQLAMETGLTEKQIEQWFEQRRTVWKRFFGLFLDAQCDIEENENALQKYNAKRQNFSAAQLDKLEEIFAIHNYLSVGDMKKYATEIGITDKQVEEWFEKRRLEWELKQRKREPIDAKIAAAIHKVMEDEQNAEENAKNEGWFNERRSQWKWKYMKCDLKNDKLPPIYDKIFDAVQKAMKCAQEEAQQQNFSADQLDKLEREFEQSKHFCSCFHEKLAKEIGITEMQMNEWFENRLRQWMHKFAYDHGFKIQQSAQNVDKMEAIEQKTITVEHNSQQNDVVLNQNTAVVGAKVCAECGQQIVHQMVPQSQQNANAIDITFVGCTSVSAVRGRAKCLRLFWRAVTFPMNAVAKLVKKVRSAKSALANKVKKGKNEKK